MLFEVLVLLLVIWYILFHFKRRRLYELAAQFKGPPTLPLLGNALSCTIPYTEMVDVILKNGTYHNFPTRLWFGPYLLIYIWNPEDIKIILNSPHSLTKLPYAYRLAEFALGRGLVSLPVEEWKRHRKLISPNFNQQNLESFFGIINRHSHELVSDLKREAGIEVFDVEHYVAKCTLNSVLESLLGLNSQDSDAYRVHELVEFHKDLLVGMITRMSNILYLPDFIFKRSSAGKKFAKAKNKYFTILNSIIDKWKRDLKQQQAENQAFEKDTVPSKPKNFVEHLLMSNDEMGKLTEEELREEVHTFIVAGYDTTLTMTSFLLMMLGMHPEIQEKAYQEIVDVLGTESQELQYKDLHKFNYLERVIKETLRVFPVLIGLGRYADREIKLRENLTIPAGTNIVIGQLNLHRDPTIWPNPNTFDPDRFLPEEEAKRHPYSYIPFSAGPRNCIGFRFAQNALKIMAIDVIRNYKIRTIYKDVEEIHLSMVIGLKSTDGFKISIAAR